MRTSIQALALVLLLVLTSPLTGQTFGEITGAVTDATGGVLVGAQITVRNTATNQTRHVETNATGTYSVPFLVPAIYDVQAENAGFKLASRRGVDLQVGAVRRFRRVERAESERGHGASVGHRAGGTESLAHLLLLHPTYPDRTESSAQSVDGALGVIVVVVRLSPPRRYWSVSACPGRSRPIARPPSSPTNECPSSRRRTSPSRMPARSAGPPSTTRATRGGCWPRQMTMSPSPRRQPQKKPHVSSRPSS